MGIDSSYELIFMDMQLPIMNGIEATEQLRKLGVTTPIIALTANAFESDKAHCLTAGMDDFISKPVNLKTFQKVLEKYLKPKDQEERPEMKSSINDKPSS